MANSILITGGTGSLGRALVARLLKSDQYGRICVFSRDEWKQAEMVGEFPDPRLRFFIGDVRDPQALENAMGGVEHVIHAAALKRVDSVAYNPLEVLKTNVHGTVNVIEAAVGAGAKKVMVISSDKAVNPQNIYGASKMMAEQYAVASNAHAYPRGTWVSCVRYGNVLGSRGSVVYAFRQAVEKGEPVKITDPNCTRFWWTIGEAVDFCLLTLCRMVGGEIFIPRLKSMRILELAHASGVRQLSTNGLRPGGEKLHESLLSPEESSRLCDQYGKYLTITPALRPWSKIDPWAGWADSCNNLVYTSEKSPFGVFSVDEMREILAREGLIPNIYEAPAGHI